MGLQGPGDAVGRHTRHMGWIGRGIADAPDRAGPGRVRCEAGQHMDVELADAIAERADIELVWRVERFQSPGDRRNLTHQRDPRIL
jgi:hypothetical protein